MNFASVYFDRHSYILKEIKEPPSGLLWFSVVIPVFREEALIKVLEDLRQTNPPQAKNVEVILIFNHSENEQEAVKELNEKLFYEARSWCVENNLGWLKFYPLWLPDLPRKFAGAGLARKIGMDIALSRFSKLERPEGLILSLDADTHVQTNYFTGINGKLIKEAEAGGCLLSFAHPIEGDEFNKEVYRAIIQYELHLRYYKHFLALTGFPWAEYTIGSCFGVKASVYAKHGGMNRQQAGEDFYFLNKLFPHHHFVTVTDTCVSPSSRISDRVPFGTGPVIARLVSGSDPYTSYAPEAFLELKTLFDSLEDLYAVGKDSYAAFLNTQGEALRSFLEMNQMSKRIEEIKANTANFQSFRKRFFLWFDAFRVVKYLNFAHEAHFEKVEVGEAASVCLNYLGVKVSGKDAKGLLIRFREMDRKADSLVDR